jgi:hypothetical protein
MPLVLVLEAVTNSTTASASGSAQFASASPAVANSTAASGIIPAIQGFANGFAQGTTLVTTTLDGAALDIAKAAVVFLVIAGVLLWFSRVNRRLGREMVEGGIFIGLFIEFVVPFLMNIHY